MMEQFCSKQLCTLKQHTRFQVMTVFLSQKSKAFCNKGGGGGGGAHFMEWSTEIYSTNKRFSDLLKETQ